MPGLNCSEIEMLALFFLLKAKISRSTRVRDYQNFEFRLSLAVMNGARKIAGPHLTVDRRCLDSNEVLNQEDN